MLSNSKVFLAVSLALVVSSERVNLVDENKLIAVAVLFRHGDRAVLNSYPNDPYYNISYWPDGFGALLNSGKLRQYNLGKWLRIRYDTFLLKKYSKTDINVRSSNVDRCLMSAASNLAGLYTPSGTDIWLKDLPWQPVPIHTTPENTDSYLAMVKSCPKHRQLVDALKQEFDQNISLQFHKEFEILERNTGWKNITIDYFERLYTTFYVYEMHNRSFIPPWEKSLDKNNFEFLAGLAFAIETYNDVLKTLKAGPFFSNLLKFFDNAANDISNSHFLMMSGHDDTVVAALNTMGVYDYSPPEFASMIIWELHKDSYGHYYLKMYYKKPSRELIKELIMPSCSQPCKYVDFSNELRRFVRDEKTWETLCKVTT